MQEFKDLRTGDTANGRFGVRSTNMNLASGESASPRYRVKKALSAEGALETREPLCPMFRQELREMSHNRDQGRHQ